NRERRLSSCGDQYLALLEAVFEALHHFDLEMSGRDSQLRSALGVEVVGFERSLGTHKAVIGAHPGVVGSVRVAVFSGDKNSSRHGTAIRKHRDAQLARGPEKFPLFRYQFRLRSSQNFL